MRWPTISTGEGWRVKGTYGRRERERRAHNLAAGTTRAHTHPTVTLSLHIHFLSCFQARREVNSFYFLDTIVDSLSALFRVLFSLFLSSVGRIVLLNCFDYITQTQISSVSSFHAAGLSIVGEGVKLDRVADQLRCCYCWGGGGDSFRRYIRHCCQ